jgi:hypothetical protein
MSYRAIPVSEKDECEVWVKARTKKKFPYREVAMLISEGHEVFVPELNRRTASYARNALSKALGTEVFSFPAMLKGEKGYIFKVSIFREVLGGAEGEDKKGDREARGGAEGR